ncbi:MAG: AAA family ATPase [Hyphomicrobiaceae bacterium]
MTVIAMTREMGSRGKEVAAGLAAEMDLEVVHHELVAQHVCERIGIQESSVHRFLEGRSYLWERWNLDEKRLSRFTADEILQLAFRGNVIIRGWGAAHLLADIPHVLCARVCAPMENRIDEMVDRLNEAAWEAAKPIEHSPAFVREAMRVTRDDARREVELSDRAHAKVILKQFGKDWQDALHYDVVLNTGRMSISDCIKQLRSLTRSEDYRPTDSSLQILKDRLTETNNDAALV